MSDETLALWTSGQLKLEPHRFYTAWSKFNVLLNMVLDRFLRTGELPEIQEASVYIWLPQQIKDKPRDASGKTRPFRTHWDATRSASDKLLPDAQIYRLPMDLDSTEESPS